MEEPELRDTQTLFYSPRGPSDRTALPLIVVPQRPVERGLVSLTPLVLYTLRGATSRESKYPRLIQQTKDLTYCASISALFQHS